MAATRFVLGAQRYVREMDLSAGMQQSVRVLPPKQRKNSVPYEAKHVLLKVRNAAMGLRVPALFHGAPVRALNVAVMVQYA